MPRITEPSQAVKTAVDYFEKVVAPVTKDVQMNLESLEMSQDSKQWLVTLSHRDLTTSSVYTLYPNAAPRLYKLFTIDVASGNVLSMKSTKP